MKRTIRTVAIAGAGPAGASLATYLARSGRQVFLFDAGKRPPLVVGESLVPAIIPFLKDLGIEDEVRSYSIYKPGATFVLRDGVMSFSFDQVRDATTSYAYNTPRDRLDASILAAARRAGVHVIEATARFERDGEDRVRLAEASVDACRPLLDGQPDFVVDATGRSRNFARLLDLPTVEGGRRDIALFAHCEGVPLVCEGHVHTDHLERGWAWRIPLPGRVSVGLVLPTEFARTFGSSNEEQFDAYLAHDPAIKAWGGEPKRISQVLKYNNYQQTTLQGFGPNWALAGDAFGFVDPVFSSGLLVSMDSARQLAHAIEGGRDADFARYQKHVLKHIYNWKRVIGHFYDGRLFTLFQVGDYVRGTGLGKIMDFHFSKHMPRVFTGESTSGSYSVGLLNFMCDYGLYNNDPSLLAVR